MLITFFHKTSLRNIFFFITVYMDLYIKRELTRAILRPFVKVAYFEEKCLNWKFHRSIYYSITVWKFFPLRFQQLRQTEKRKEQKRKKQKFFLFFSFFEVAENAEKKIWIKLLNNKYFYENFNSNFYFLQENKVSI